MCYEGWVYDYHYDETIMKIEYMIFSEVHGFIGPFNEQAKAEEAAHLINYHLKFIIGVSGVDEWVIELQFIQEEFLVLDVINQG